MFEITCGAGSRALLRKEKHEADLKMKLLSPGATPSPVHTSSLYTHVTVNGAARVTGMNGLICETHRPAWRWCVSLATSSIPGQRLTLSQCTQLTGQGLLYFLLIAIQSWFDPYQNDSSSFLLLSLCLYPFLHPIFPPKLHVLSSLSLIFWFSKPYLFTPAL